MTKTVEPISFGSTHTYIAHKREYFPGHFRNLKLLQKLEPKFWHITIYIINSIAHVAKRPQALCFLQNMFPATIPLDSTRSISLTDEACVMSRQ